MVWARVCWALHSIALLPFAVAAIHYSCISLWFHFTRVAFHRGCLDVALELASPRPQAPAVLNPHISTIARFYPCTYSAILCVQYLSIRYPESAHRNNCTILSLHTSPLSCVYNIFLSAVLNLHISTIAC